MPSNNLKKLRKDKKLTLTALSERSGVSIAQIWNIENKPGTPRKATMAALAKALGCRVSTVFPDTKSERVTPAFMSKTKINTNVIPELKKVFSELDRLKTLIEAAFPR